MTTGTSNNGNNRIAELIDLINNLKKSDFQVAGTQKEKGGENINIIVSSLKELVEELKIRNEDAENKNVRINNIMDFLLKYTVMDFSEKIQLSNKGDEIDAIAVGVNTLVEELQFSLLTEKKYNSKLEKKNAQLIESEERFRMLIENVRDYAIFMIDPDGNIISWNKGAEYIKGYSESEIIGKHISVFYTNEGISEGEPGQNLQMALENGRFEKEGIRKRKDGTQFWADVVITAMYDGSGKLRGYSKIIRDITQSRKAQENLKNTVDQLSEAQQMAHIGSWEWNLATNSITWSDELFRIYGLQPQQFPVTFGSAEKYIHPDYKKLVDEITVPAYKDKTSFSISYHIINSKGNERIVEEHCKPVLDKKRKVVKMFGTVYDVTGQREVENALRASEEKFNKAFQLSPAGIAITDIDTGLYLDANESFLKTIEFSREEVIGHSSLDTNILDPVIRKELIEEIITYGAVKNREVVFRKKSGETGTLLFSTEKIEINGKSCTLTITYDITRRKKIEMELEQRTEELRRSNTELEQFAYVASHDLQEPLRTITSYVQLLANRYKDKLDEDANDFIGYAVDGSNRMRNLISSLLEYSRVNRIKPFEWIDMNEKLEEVLLDLKTSIKENDAKIIIGELPDIIGDTVLIGQLFNNLIANSLKFKSDRPPVITVSGRQVNGEYLFSVEDNGIGIQKEYKDKIFVIFQQLHSKGKYPGTGIGLSVCKKIVERHGGKIWVDSELNRGSTFNFTIKRNLKN